MRKFLLAIPLLLIGCGTHVPKLTATNTQEGVLLSWDEDDATAVAYNVYRSDGSNGFERINNGRVTATWFTDSTVEAETYSYQVTAVDASGVEGDPSAAVTISVP